MINLINIIVGEEDTLEYAMEQINKNNIRMVFVVFKNKLKAVLSDGDIRRYLLKGGKLEDKVKYIANYTPVYIMENQERIASEIIDETKVSVLPITNYNGEIVDIYLQGARETVVHSKLLLPVVIMAGGMGTRLYPYTKILPKPLIPIGELPITEHIIRRFVRYECTDIYMIVNHKKSMIKSYFDGIEKSYNLYFADENEPLGTGGGLSLLKKQIHSDFFFTNCDIIIDADYSAIYEHHKVNNNFITIVCAKKENKIPYGVIQTEDNVAYCGMKEKPSYEVLINTGLYIVNSKVIQELECNKNISFPEIIDEYRHIGRKIGIYIIEGDAFMDMGQLEELETMRKRLGEL